MNFKAIFATVLASALLLMFGCSYVPFSSGKLDGNLSPAPADWSAAAQAKIIELETQPTDPYSVKLWIVGLGASLYVHAGANRTTWVEHIEIDPNVRVLIDDKLYELHAKRVTDAGEFKTFSDAYEIKYGSRPRNESVIEAYLFKLSPRA